LQRDEGKVAFVEHNGIKTMRFVGCCRRLVSSPVVNPDFDATVIILFIACFHLQTELA
jgi:hypothetical protein